MITLDIFKNDAFSVMSLTTYVNELPFVPGQVGKSALFTEEGVTTTVIGIENDKGTLRLVPNTPRTSPANQNTRTNRQLRYFQALHLPQEDTVTSDELQNVRPRPNQGEVETVQGLLQPKLRRMVSSNEATVEYGRINAIKGQIFDADGATLIYDLFNEFGISQPTFDMAFGTSGQSQATNGTDVANLVEDALGGAPWTGLVAYCGRTFYKRLISHPTVVNAYAFFNAQNQLNPNRDDMRYKGFIHGGIMYVQYRGTVGGVRFVPDNEAHVYPEGVPELFKTFFAPANYLETANTMGVPMYSKQGQDPSGYNKYTPFEVQSNPISLCTRPGCLYKLYSSN